MREDAEVQIGPKCTHCVRSNSCALIGVREIDRGERLGNKVYREQKDGLMLEGVDGWWQRGCCVC